MTNSGPYQIAAVGHVPADIFIEVDEAFLNRHGFVKGGNTPIERALAFALLEDFKGMPKEPGGSAANTLACVSAIGGKTVFLTTLADDEIGRFLAKGFEKNGVHFSGNLCPSEEGSDFLFAMVTPDRERSFACYYGISETLGPEHLDLSAISHSEIVLLEGYLLNNRHGFSILKAGAAESRKQGKKAVFSPCDFGIAEKKRHEVMTLTGLSDYVILNETEAFTLTETGNLDTAISALKTMVPAGAVTQGEGGATVFNTQEIIHVPTAPRTAPVVNTNGAGDHFAAGFLYGVLTGLPMEKSAKLGHLCAAESLGHLSGRPQQSLTYLIEKI